MKKKNLESKTYVEPLLFENDYNTLEVFVSDRLNNISGRKFCLQFNAKLETFKTFRGLQNRVNKLIEKYTLKQTN